MTSWKKFIFLSIKMILGIGIIHHVQPKNTIFASTSQGRPMLLATQPTAYMTNPACIHIFPVLPRSSRIFVFVLLACFSWIARSLGWIQAWKRAGKLPNWTRYRAKDSDRKQLPSLPMSRIKSFPAYHTSISHRWEEQYRHTSLLCRGRFDLLIQCKDSTEWPICFAKSY